jgi:hypothetical protein
MTGVISSLQAGRILWCRHGRNLVVEPVGRGEAMGLIVVPR